MSSLISNPRPADAEAGKQAGRYASAVEVRPGMAEGEPFAFMLRRWGPNGWSTAEGQPHFYTNRADADRARAEWLA